MIKSFTNKELANLFDEKASKLDQRLHGRIKRRLDALDAVNKAEDMNVSGFNFHPLNGFNPTRYSVHVNGPWCITFEFYGGHAWRVNFEQYH